MLVTIRLVSITCLSSVLRTSGLFQTVIAPLAQMLQKIAKITPCSPLQTPLQSLNKQTFGSAAKTKRGNLSYDTKCSVTLRGTPHLYKQRSGVPLFSPRKNYRDAWSQVTTPQKILDNSREMPWVKCKQVFNSSNFLLLLL